MVPFCTKSIFISKGSFRDAESKNIIFGLVQKVYEHQPSFKLPAFMHRHIGPTIQISEILGLPIAMVPCLHQKKIISKGSFSDEQPKNIILGLVQRGIQTSSGLQITRIHLEP